MVEKNICRPGYNPEITDIKKISCEVLKLKLTEND